ncbi:MAG: NAD/NADP octopine/nopaline dehydrogenase family protein [Bacteroidales bacterium]|nr:NAD/NADP octopine/nopaline dehydrogenase family protein [Bacteroidales bacterium]
MKKVCICGGGSLGHVVAGWLTARNHAEVNILTGRPEKWNKEIFIDTPEGEVHKGRIDKISSKPEDVIPESDVVLLCLPGFMIAKQLEVIKPELQPSTFVGSVFSSTGFFFEALSILGDKQPLWGFQRVPFISRVNEYGKSAHLLGFKNSHNIAIENVSNNKKVEFGVMMQNWFERPINILQNYYEASLTNSNPLLHTARLYTMFGGVNEGKIYDRMILFYEEWNEIAADLYLKMDDEFFSLLHVLPVSKGYLPPVLEYYESNDAKSLAAKLSSIQGFKGITSPMKQVDNGWIPDFQSRYFTEDFPYGLRYIWQLAHENNIDCPNIDMVYEWGMSKLK